MIGADPSPGLDVRQQVAAVAGCCSGDIFCVVTTWPLGLRPQRVGRACSSFWPLEELPPMWRAEPQAAASDGDQRKVRMPALRSSRSRCQPTGRASAKVRPRLNMWVALPQWQGHRG